MSGTRRMVSSVTEDDRAQQFAKYLNDNPDAAKQLRSSVSSMLAQYNFATNAFASIGSEVLKFQQQTFEALKSIHIPTDLLAGVREVVAGLFPSNWPHRLPDMTRIEQIIEKDGIPVVHVPRSEIVQAIMDAADYDARVRILEERADDIASDCEEALARDYDAALEKQLPLAQKAVAAYQAGHFEAAQALAVSVCDTYLKKMFVQKSYDAMQTALAVDKSDNMAVAVAFNFHYALASAVPFLVKWMPGDPGEPPTTFSRHVSIHNANIEQMTKRNATIAIMLVTSMSVGIDYQAKRLRKAKGAEED
jgi:hypothetical protein